MHSFQLHQPSTVQEALALLQRYGPEARILAGGTDLIIQMTSGRIRPAVCISSSRLLELDAIVCDSEGSLRIGGTATLRQVELHPEIRRRYPALAQGAREVGSVQIRNLATLAGNLCNASPSADTSPALLAYDAEVELTGPSGTRTLALDRFWKGPGRTDLRPDEMLTAIVLPHPPADQKSFYFKLAVRRAMDLAMVGVTVTASGEPQKREVRIALGAVAPVCFRAAEAEQLATQGAGLQDAAAAAAAACSPIDDQRASASYRRQMVQTLVLRGLNRVMSKEAR